MKKLYLVCVLFVLSLLSLRAADGTGVITYYGLRDYTVIGISPNGKWAAGYFQSGGTGLMYAFRWNLETNQTELLTGSADASFAYGVSNDGTVIGEYPDHTVTSNGASVTVPGYYRDGSWHTLEPIDGFDSPNAVYSGWAQAISPDGVWMGGAIYDSGGKCRPAVWKNGRIHKVFDDSQGCVYAINADGTKASGWAYKPGGDDVRFTVVWDVETGDATWLSNRGNPFNQGTMFTSDGRYLLHASDPGSDGTFSGGIYDTQTETNTIIPFHTSGLVWNHEHRCIDDNRNVYGYETDMMQSTTALVYHADGTSETLDAYFASKGVDLSGLSLYRLLTVTACSADGKTLAVSTTNSELYEHPLIVRMDQNVTNREPVALTAEQVDGLMAAKLTWNVPVNNPDNITGYNIYRDGTKLNTTPVTECLYIDNSELAQGSYTYTVTAVYDEVESAQSEASTVAIAPRAISAPRSLYARQKGCNSAALTWNAPATNLISKGYYDADGELTAMGGGANSFEFAIKYDKSEMDAYSGYSITKVSFIPETEQSAWELRIYSGSNLIYSQPITQALDYGRENVVVLNNPVPVSSLTDDVYCAISVTVPVTAGDDNMNVVGVDMNHCVPGYSDLIRLASEPEFYSLSEASRENSYVFDLAYAMSMVLSSPDDAADIDDLSQYNIYADGELLGSTASRSYVHTDLADGTHNYEVEAQYSDGRVSPRVSASVDIALNLNAYTAISDVKCFGDATQVEISWPAPKDDDAQNITYSSDNFGQTINYGASGTAYVARSIYTADMFRGLNGYVISKLRFYAVNDAAFTLYVYKDGELLTEIPVDDYTLGQWNVVTLSQPIAIEEGAQYTYDIDVFDGSEAGGALAVDNQPTVSSNAVLASTDGGVSFSELDGTGTGNWMMGMVVSDPAGRPLEVDGYNVRLDGTQLNSSLITDTRYVHTFAADADHSQQHRVNVDVTYTGRGELRGSAVFFTIDALVDGIDNTVTADLRVYPNPATSYVVAEGANVEELSAFSLGGALVGKTTGNRLDVSTYAPGLYILKIKADGKVKTVKLNVIR